MGVAVQRRLLIVAGEASGDAHAARLIRCLTALGSYRVRGVAGPAMTALRARVTAGDPPTAVQMLGFDILDWAGEGALGDLTEVAAAEGWDETATAPS